MFCDQAMLIITLLLSGTYNQQQCTPSIPIKIENRQNTCILFANDKEKRKKEA